MKQLPYTPPPLPNGFQPLPHPLPNTKRRPPENAKILYSNVYWWRHRMRMKQEDLARLVGVSRRTIHNIELCKNVPSIVLVLKIAHVLGQPVESLFKLHAHVLFNPRTQSRKPPR